MGTPEIQRVVYRRMIRAGCVGMLVRSFTAGADPDDLKSGALDVE